jgi:branched-chain amino acid transport system permease protein
MAPARLFTLLLCLVLAVGPPFLGTATQNMLAQMLIAALFATAFNLLSGQAGLLSFGHAAFFGIGAITTLHAMLAAERNARVLPTPFLPLVGGLASAAFGLFAGYFATRRSGVYFALVTLAIAELLHSLAPRWDSLFGGEAGLSSMRMPWAGIGFGTSLEVYYLTLAWTVLSILCLWAYTRTAFGRLTLALRENEQRALFLGYDTHRTKVIVFTISAAFSGVAGALLAVMNETANYTLFSTHTSAQVVLQSFIGGTMLFLGPALGAASLSLFAFLVSDVTRSWLLYQGVLFVLIMLYAPSGLGGVIAWHARHWTELNWRELIPAYLLAGVSALLLAGAFVFVVETMHRLFSGEYQAARRAAGGAFPPYHLFGSSWSPLDARTWAVPLSFAVAGTLGLRFGRRLIRRALQQRTETRELLAPPLASGATPGTRYA